MIGWYRPIRAGFVAATIGALIACLSGRLVMSNVIRDPGNPGALRTRRSDISGVAEADMGLMIFSTEQTDRVQSQLPAGGQGMSPIMTAMLALLAHKGGGLETCLAVSRVCKIRTGYGSDKSRRSW
jgi:hypothetical protein